MTVEKRYRTWFQRTANIAAVIIIVALLTGWIMDGLNPSWKQIQREYRSMIREACADAGIREAIIPPAGIYQVKLPQFNRMDRCMTCHQGIDQGSVSFDKQPFAAHPSTLLNSHPVREFGCTVCHGGQGQALDKRDAFGENPRNAWDQPILDAPFLESSCGKCHLSLFTPDEKLNQSRVLEQGRKLFVEEGCLGCHKARGLGGILGPDLTEQGDKSKHEYNFRNINGKQTISNWLQQHFQDPEMVSPGSVMLQYDLPETDLEALATLVMGLSKANFPYRYVGMNVLAELKGDRPEFEGDQVFRMICSSCHGKNGQGKPYQSYESGVPGIGRDGFLAVASEDYIGFILNNGRQNPLMTSWKSSFSGFHPEELKDLNRFVRSKRLENSSWALVSERFLARDGSEKAGQQVFNDLCQTCHEADARGGLAVGFNNVDFFRAASVSYLYHTLFRGRMNTAMPSWSWLDNLQMTDLIAYIASLGPELTLEPPVFPFKSTEPTTKPGADLFHYACSRCHGAHGEGNTGPAILNQDFIKTVDDHFLYQTIAYGRIHTPMHGWTRKGKQEGGLTSGEIKEVIRYIRSCADTIWDYNYPGPTLGKADRGDALYRSLCADCHGVHGTGIKAPSLNDQVFLNAATNGFITATITIGREGTPMPAWGYASGMLHDGLERGYPVRHETHRKLTAQERLDLTAWIRSWQVARLKN